jgi:hypothetical protein
MISKKKIYQKVIDKKGKEHLIRLMLLRFSNCINSYEVEGYDSFIERLARIEIDIEMIKQFMPDYKQIKNKMIKQLDKKIIS